MDENATGKAPETTAGDHAKPPRLTLLSHGVGLSLQAPPRGARAGPARTARGQRPTRRSSGTDTRDDAAVWQLDAARGWWRRSTSSRRSSTTRALGADRRRQRALRRLRDGRNAALRAEPRRLAARRSRSSCSGEILAGGAETAAEAGCPDRRRPQRRRPGAQVRPGGDRRSSIPAHHDQRRSETRRRAAPGQGAGHRHRRRRHQARDRRRGADPRGDRADAPAQPRGGRGVRAATGSRCTRSPT